MKWVTKARRSALQVGEICILGCKFMWLGRDFTGNSETDMKIIQKHGYLPMVNTLGMAYTFHQAV